MTYNSSEHAHSDAWTALNTKYSTTFFLPIFGDVNKNFVEFYLPKNEFDEKWLDQKYFSSDLAKSILKFYKKINFNFYSLGKYILADCSVLHKSVVKKNAGVRVSIDIGIIPRFNFGYKSHFNHIEKKVISQIGKQKIYFFKDTFDKKIKFTKIGTKTMKNRFLKNL